MKRALILAPLLLACAALMRAEESKAPSSTPAAASAGAQELADFIRFREDAKGAQLQTAIASYRNAQGAVVELIGAIHIADEVYYEKLNKRFPTYEAVLYEMIGEELEAIDETDTPPLPPATLPAPKPNLTPKSKTAPPAPAASVPPSDSGTTPGKSNKGAGDPATAGKPNSPARPYMVPKQAPSSEAKAEQAARDQMVWLHPLFNILKSTLKLESQLEGIDYSRPNFVHADMTARQFAALQQQRGEGFTEMLMRAMQTQVAQPDAAAKTPSLLKILEVLSRPDSPTEIKRIVGRIFDEVEKLMGGIEGSQGSVIVAERNKVALAVLQKELDHGRKHLGIFYGAAHMPDMDQRLQAMGFKREKVEWLTAWDLPPEPPPAPPTKKG